MKRLFRMIGLGGIMVLTALSVRAPREAAASLQQTDGSPLSGRGYLVIMHYENRTTFDYYDFGTDGTFSIWTLEGEGTGTYDVKNNIIFKALFRGSLTAAIEFTYQIKGFIFSERMLFGEGEEYLSGSEAKRFYFLGLSLNALIDNPLMEYRFLPLPSPGPSPACDPVKTRFR